MFWFIAGILLVVGSVVGLMLTISWYKLIPVATLVLGIAMIVSTCLVQVSTKNVGIETTFGKPSGELSNGLHFKAPWEKVTEMDAAIQTDSYATEKNCIHVRVSAQQLACAYVNFQWRINPAAAQELYRDYRTFEHVRDALVTRKLTEAINEQLVGYNPLNSVVGAEGGSKNPSLPELAAAINKQMKEEIGGPGGKIEVLSTILPLLGFDKETQARINQLQQQVALTRIAVQQRRTNEAQAKANKALAASVNTSPNVLVSHCYSILETMVKNGQAVPAGFSCWPGNKLSGIIASPPNK